MKSKEVRMRSKSIMTLAMTAAISSLAIAQETAPENSQTSEATLPITAPNLRANSAAESMIPEAVGGLTALELIPVRPGSTRVPLRRGHVMSLSERLDLGGRILDRDRDYTVDYAAGVIVLLVPVQQGDSLRVSYRYDATKAQTGRFTGDNSATTASLSLVPGATFALGMGVTERSADGRVTVTDIYGLANNFNAGGLQIKGGIYAGERRATESVDLMTGAGSGAQGAQEGSGQAIVQSAALPVAGGTISVDYRAIDKNFMGMDALGGAGFNADQINQFARERGLKRTNFSARGLRMGGMVLGSGMHTVGDANGSIDWRSMSLQYGGLQVNFNSQTVDQGFTRFNDIAEEDRGQLAKERGLERTNIDAVAQTGIGKFGFTQLGVSEQGVSDLRRRALSYEGLNLKLHWFDQHVEDGFRRFGDLREGDRGQLAKEVGMRRENFSFALAGPTALSYTSRILRDDTGRLNQQDLRLTAGRLTLDHRFYAMNSGFERFGSQSGEEINGAVQSIVAMMGPGVNPNGNDARMLANSQGMERTYWGGSYGLSANSSVTGNWFRLGSSEGGIEVQQFGITSKNLNLALRTQTSSDTFEDRTALTATEQRILGTDTGFDRTNADLSMNLGGARQLTASYFRANDLEGGLNRQWFQYKDKGFEATYRHRSVDQAFGAFRSLDDGERDLFGAMRGNSQTESLVNWAVNKNLNLQYASNSGQSEDGVTQFNNSDIKAQINLDRLTRINLQLWENNRFDPTASLLDQSYRHFELFRNMGRLGELTLRREESSWDGSEENRPDSTRDTLVYQTQLNSTTSIRTEHSEAKFEDGTRETLRSNTINTQLTPRAGVSVTDSHIDRDNSQPDQTRRDYGFWLDFGSNIRLNWNSARNLNGAGNATRDQRLGLTAGQFSGMQVGGDYRHQGWDGQRDLHQGNFSLSNIKPMDWGFLKDVRFNFTADTHRDLEQWKKENRSMGFGGRAGNFGFGFDYRSQIDALQQRAIDRVFTVSTDTTGKASIRADIHYNVRTMPDNSMVMVRDFRFIAGAGQTWSVSHEMKTNPLRDESRALLGSVATEWRVNQWRIGYNGLDDAKLGLVFDEKINDNTKQLIRSMGIDATLFASSPSPLRLEYRLNQDERNNKRQTRHWFSLAYDQRPGPNQTFGISVTNLNWEHARPQSFAPNQWGLRFDYSFRF